MPEYVVNRVAEALNEHRKPLNGSRVHLLGVAYKRDIDDVRESPALDVIELLKRRGAIVTYSDPYVPTVEHGSHELTGISVAEAVAASTDCAVIVTDHKAFDYPGIVASFPLVVDTRNALKGIKSEKIFVLYSGCRVQGAGCRVRCKGAGCRVQGCGVQGAGCRVHGCGASAVRSAGAGGSECRGASCRGPSAGVDVAPCVRQERRPGITEPVHPRTLHPAPCTPHRTQHPAPGTLHLHPAPCTLHLAPNTFTMPPRSSVRPAPCSGTSTARCWSPAAPA